MIAQNPKRNPSQVFNPSNSMMMISPRKRCKEAPELEKKLKKIDLVEL